MRPSHIGRKKWFDVDQGFGVIVADDGLGEVWVGFSVIDMPGYRKLSEGQRIEFRYETPQGGQDGFAYRATWVRPLAVPI